MISRPASRSASVAECCWQFSRQLSWLAIFFAAATAFAQTQQGDPARGIPEEIAGEKMSELLEKWPEQYVKWIIADEEKRRYEAIEADEDKLRFIETFWKRRDPTPNTAFNEFRHDYLERYAFTANRFSAGKPGWATDRGRLYLTLGPPHSIQQNPTGRYGLERASEIWTYNNLDIPEMPASIDFEFVDFNGTGDFEIVQDIDAAAPMWSQFGTTNNALDAIAQRRNRIGEEDPRTGIARFRDVDGSRVAMREFDLQQRLQSVDRAATANLRPWSEIVESSFTFRTLPIGVVAGTVRGPETDGMVPVSLALPYRDLSPEREGDEFVYRLNYLIRLLDSAAGPDGDIELARIEDDLVLRIASADYARINEQRIGIEEALTAPPGDYRLQVFVRDSNEEKVGTQELPISVPERSGDALSLSSLFVTSAILNGVPGSERPFQFGAARIVPHASGEFTRNQNMEIYVQAYGTSRGDAGTGKLTIKCFVMKDGKIHLGYPDSFLFPDTEPVGITAALPLRRLEPGGYRVLVRVIDDVSGQAANVEAPFSIVSSQTSDPAKP